MENQEETFVFLKPDGQRIEVISDFLSMSSMAGLVVSKFRVVSPTLELFKQHYEEYKDAPFFGDMYAYLMRTGIIPAMILSGENAVKKVREIVGATKPWEAQRGSIRYKYGFHEPGIGGILYNVIHAADSVGNATREENLWLPHPITV